MKRPVLLRHSVRILKQALQKSNHKTIHKFKPHKKNKENHNHDLNHF